MYDLNRGTHEGAELEALKRQVRDFFAAARAQGLWVGAGRDGTKPFTDERQYGPLAKALLTAVSK
ncbi:hypothetical protein [Aminobacter sp. HY435]|uniref:hypothetical protein n=1 Tax=Aminobacter sp. HY435 TaxID=2970917 RepID=UPI0022B96A3F|nr:hypothetical protein [Aminobacter sp. HY435]